MTLAISKLWCQTQYYQASIFLTVFTSLARGPAQFQLPMTVEIAEPMGEESRVYLKSGTGGSDLGLLTLVLLLPPNGDVVIDL
jgi:hypothetical protein